MKACGKPNTQFGFYSNFSPFTETALLINFRVSMIITLNPLQFLINSGFANYIINSYSIRDNKKKTLITLSTTTFKILNCYAVI